MVTDYTHLAFCALIVSGCIRETLFFNTAKFEPRASISTLTNSQIMTPCLFDLPVELVISMYAEKWIDVRDLSRLMRTCRWFARSPPLRYVLANIKRKKNAAGNRRRMKVEILRLRTNCIRDITNSMMRAGNRIVYVEMNGIIYVKFTDIPTDALCEMVEIGALTHGTPDHQVQGWSRRVRQSSSNAELCAVLSECINKMASWRALRQYKLHIGG